MDDEHIRHWLTCYNLKSRVRGLDDRSRLDDQTVRYHSAPSMRSFISSRKSVSSLAPTWEQSMYRKVSPLSSTGSVVWSALNQNLFRRQGAMQPSLRLPTPQPRHRHPPPLPLRPHQLRQPPHQREGRHRSIRWLCSTRRAHSMAMSSTGSVNPKVLPTSLAGQSSASVSSASLILAVIHIAPSQWSAQRLWGRQEPESGKGRISPSGIPVIGLGK